MSTYPIPLRFILILFSHLQLGLPSGLFPSDFNKIMYAFIFSTTGATHPSYRPWLSHPNNTRWGQSVLKGIKCRQKVKSYSIRNFNILLLTEVQEPEYLSLTNRIRGLRPGCGSRQGPCIFHPATTPVQFEGQTTIGTSVPRILWPQVKPSGSATDRSRLSIADTQNGWSYTSVLPIAHRVLG